MPAEKIKVNYQPQVPSTVNGPAVHRFIPPGSCCVPHAPTNCVACSPHNRLGNHNCCPQTAMPFAGASCSCGADVNVNVRGRAYAGAYAGAGYPGLTFLGPIPGGVMGYPGHIHPGNIVHSASGGGNIIINNGPTAAGGHILQGAGGPFGVGFPSQLGGYGHLRAQSRARRAAAVRVL